MSTEEQKLTFTTQYKANIVLALSGLGLLIAFPFQDSFWGGLITSGCAAALVGGLADWFAVNALFRRPLGIPNGRIFRTEIIPRNKTKIFQALSTMVEEELLTQDALKEKLANYDYVTPIEKILYSPNKEKLQSQSEEVLEHLIQHILPLLQTQLTEKSDALDVLRVEAYTLLESDDFQQKFTLLLEKTLQELLHSEEGENLIKELIFTLKLWVEDTEIHLWLTHLLEDAIEGYISQHPSRRILAIFLPSPSELAQITQNKIASYLMEEETSEEIKMWLEKGIQEVFRPKILKGETNQSEKTSQSGETNQTEEISQSRERENIDPPKSFSEQITEKLIKGIIDQFNRYLQSASMGKLNEENVLKALHGEFNQKVHKTLHNLQQDLQERQAFNTWIYHSLLPLIESKHGQIKVMIYEGLQGYSGEELTELIESKAGDDLQMIRINGSVVGGLLGILIYLVNGIFI